MNSKNIFACLALFATFMISCTKETQSPADNVFIKTINNDSSMVVVGNLQVADYIITVCRSFDEKTPGYMFKTDGKGNLIWKKPVPEKNLAIWQVYDLRGNGFATIGFGPNTSLAIELCMYDDDGNLLNTKQIPLSIIDSWATNLGFYSPFQMLQLSNGYFAFAGTYQGGPVILCITNSSFDTLTQTKITMPNRDNVSSTFMRGICEHPNGTIIMSSSASIIAPGYLHFRYETNIIRTDLQGNLISNTSIQTDSLHNETPNALLNMGDKLFLITTRMGTKHDGSGTFVNYLNSYYGFVCAGEINLLQLSSNGELLFRQSIRDYPANGMIMNARPTADGGYILCGTVDQSTTLSIISPTKIYIMKVNASGNFEWSKSIKTSYPSYGVDAVQTSDGGYYITGYEKTFDKRFNAIVIKTDAHGNY
jgi:hypothetical protein